MREYDDNELRFLADIVVSNGENWIYAIAPLDKEYQRLTIICVCRSFFYLFEWAYIYYLLKLLFIKRNVYSQMR